MSGIQRDHAGTDLASANLPAEHVERLRTAGSVAIDPRLFEELYLSPHNVVKGNLRKTFGNPTPLALVGFILCLTPFSCDLMGWRGAGGNGAAGTATYFFYGGLLMIIGSVLEFFLGNTFPFVVFGSFGAFWLSYGGTLQPFYNAAGAYAGGNQGVGLSSAGFTNSFAFFLLFFAFLNFIYMIASIRTNVVFFFIFFFLVITMTIIAGSFWQAGQGNASFAMTLQKTGGGFAFVVSMLGWYLFTAQILLAVDFPMVLPVGDLSTVVNGRSGRIAEPGVSTESA
ncbi:alcS [Hyphodiscus hymeniophilus]|uniref:AlcS n=1 Tax=Hyphodiscus hymeniophilus TaxID=353542 RepID=A0A9P6VE95_9HELO|nr:alcS [Hyphodiscus hymeniophilus]